jgi:hypothetical protein
MAADLNVAWSIQIDAGHAEEAYTPVAHASKKADPEIRVRFCSDFTTPAAGYRVGISYRVAWLL